MTKKKYEKHLIKWTSMNQWSIVLTCSSFETPSCPLTNRLGIGKAPWEFSVIRVLPTVAALLGLKESMQKRMLWTGESTYFLNKLLCLPRKKQKKTHHFASWSWCYWLSAKKINSSSGASSVTQVSWDELKGKLGIAWQQNRCFCLFIYTLKNRCVVYLFHETKSGNVESVPNTFTAPLDTQQMFQKDLFEAKKKRRCVSKKYW